MARNEWDRGFVLVSVIWIAGLLAVITTAFTISVRSHSLAAGNAFYNTRAELVADGMAMVAAYKLANAVDASQRPKLNGEPTHCGWPDGISVSITVQDQGGLVDLNTASPDLIGALLQGFAVDKSKSAEIMGALHDFRDADSISALGGDEPAAFPGKPYGPKNRPLAVPEEIGQLPELHEALFDKLMPLVTVSSQQPGIDLARAPRQLLDILGINDVNGAAAQRFSSPSPANVFSIDVMAELSNGSRYRRQALVSLLRQPDSPFAILAWRRGGDAGEAVPAPTGRLPCFN